MNQNTMNNSGLQRINSFVTNNMRNIGNTVSNAVTNMGSNMTNTLSSTYSDISAPIADSLNATKNITPFPFISIPIIIGIGILIVLLVLLIVFKNQITDSINMLWGKIKGISSGPSAPSMPIIPPDFIPGQEITTKVLPGKKQVFNIAENKYTYSDAEPLCKAFGAELATYDQVKQAWNDGADWCNYGWVKGQAAVYPTQETTFNLLQQGTEDQKMACGTPGVNGGYFDNPELRFGVNCYGTKPLESSNDIKNIMANPGDLTPGVLKFEKKVLDYKANLGEIPVNPFSLKSWSE
jgi:hypothetical protein